jgi:hypothetical protein
MMNQRLHLWIVILLTALTAYGCSPREESPQGESKNKVKEAVKEAVTQDFKVYEGAKESLKESQDKSKSEIEAVDKELQQ